MFLPDVDEGLYTALVASDALRAIVGTDIFNGLVPTSRANAFPRVVIGAATDRDATTGEGATLSHTTGRAQEQLHLWSRASRTELFNMYNAIWPVLHHQPVSLPNGAEMLDATVEWVTDMVDPDGVTLHAVVRFSAVARR